MRPALRWTLAATVLATIGVAFLPDEQPLSAPARARALGPTQLSNATAQPAAEQPPNTDHGPPAAERVRDAGRAVGLTSKPEAKPSANLSANQDAHADAHADASPDTTRKPWSSLSPAAQATWLPPAPPQPAAPPPVRQAAAAEAEPAPAPPPAFAYKWLGHLLEDGKTQVFLAGPQRTEVVAVGQTLPEGWRVDGVQDDQLHLTWLATGTAVTVAARP